MDRNELLKILKEPRNGPAIRQARRDEKWLNAFASGENSTIVFEQYASWFVPEMRDTVYSMFEMHTLPMLSPGTGTVFTHYNKINDTVEGRTHNYYTGSGQELLELVAYLNRAYMPTPGMADGIGSAEFFGKRVLEAILYRPNTRIVIDFPVTANASKPYVSLVDIRDVHDLEEDEAGTVYFIAAYTDKSKTLFHCYTRESYQLWEKKSGQYRQVSEAPHSFGICPVRAVSPFLKHTSGREVKKSPISDSIPDIRSYNFEANMAKVFHWRNGWPLHFGLKSACQQSDPVTGAACQDGWMIIEEESEGQTVARRVRCPSCERRQKEGMRFGKSVDIDVEDIEQKPEMADALKKIYGFVGTDTGLLQFNEEKLEKERLRIEADITGYAWKGSQARQAVNEKQVEAGLEDKQNSLANMASRIETLQQWCENAIGRIMFPGFQKAAIWYGRTFYLKGPKDHQSEYQDLVTAGADDFVLNAKLLEVFTAQHRYDPSIIEAYRYVSAIVPMRHVPTTKVLQLMAKPGLPPELVKDCYFRLNAASWIEEFMLLKAHRVFRDGVSPESKLRKTRRFFADKTNT